MGTTCERIRRDDAPADQCAPQAGRRWTITSHEPGRPLVAVALHDGHDIRAEARPHLALDDAARRREEDPFTAAWTTIAPHQVVVGFSRFEVDFNRDRDGALYRRPEQAWGLRVWQDDTPAAVWAESLALHARFRRDVQALLDLVMARHGRFVLFDLHTYNHRRDGPHAPAADPAGNPEVNVGTRNLDRERWAPVIDAFMRDLRAFDFRGRQLDVRENVRFGGGAFSAWVARQYPWGCPLAIEVKKFFMDEWTGEADPAQVTLIRAALASTVEGVLAALARV
jgi:hypothetical protein